MKPRKRRFWIKLQVPNILVYRDLLVNHVLTPSGYKPLTAKDGEMGLRVAQQGEPDLIILPAASNLPVQAPVE